MDDKDRNRQKRTVVLGPPGEMTPTDDVLEDESDDSPWHIVDGGCGRNGTSSRKNDGEAEKKRELRTDENRRGVMTYLRYRIQLLGHFKLHNQAIAGQATPIKKKNTKP